MIKGQCGIWGVPAQIDDRKTSNGTTYLSSRAGGPYQITGTAEAMVRGHSESVKRRVTTMIVDRLRHGDQCPTITSMDVNLAREGSPLSALQRIDRLLEFFDYKSKEIGQNVGYKFEEVGTEDGDNSLEALAWTESLKQDEVWFLTNCLLEKKFISGGPKWRIEPDGYGRLDEMKYSLTPSAQGFVAMWFDQDMNEIYQKGFYSAIDKAGYKPMRIDRKEHSNKIDDEIILEIRRSRFLVADFSCEIVEVDKMKRAIPRGGVYFEAGFAKGLGLPVIWTCRKDMIEHVHFDTRQFNHILWTNADDLRTGLINRIGGDIGFGPNKPLL